MIQRIFELQRRYDLDNALWFAMGMALAIGIML